MKGRREVKHGSTLIGEETFTASVSQASLFLQKGMR